MTTRPNILLVISHDLGDYVNCYGHAGVRSPNLDGLAEAGVRFANFFATSPECTPSRGSLFTGYYPHQNGLPGLAEFGWELNDQTPHLASRLGRAGYHTHLFGQQHETHLSPDGLGYQDVHWCGGTDAQTVSPMVAGFLQSCEDKDEPWFSCVGFSDTHRPWKAETNFKSADIDVPAHLPDSDVVRRELCQFYQAIETMDHCIGQVLDALRNSPAYNNTIIIFTADHGAPFPRAKASLYDPGLKVPLIIHWPEHIEGGAVDSSLLSNIDIVPTLLEIIGENSVDDMPGRSFQRLLTGSAYDDRGCVGGTLAYDVAYDPMHFIRTERYKYIRSFALEPSDLPDDFPQEALTTFASGSWVRVDDFDVLSSPTWMSMRDSADTSRPAAEELYDLVADPNEQNNLAADTELADVLADLRQRLGRLMAETDSPFREGGHLLPPTKQIDAGNKYRAYTGQKWKGIET